MNPTAPRSRSPRWLPSAGLAGLAIGSTFTSLRNLWVQDDLPIVKVSTTLHSLARPWELFTQSWWPAPYPRELYRPLSSLLLATEWVTGSGSPVVFRAVSILLYVLATLALFHLARRILPPGTAWFAAALFAVHPLHVEAVAVAVNQGELVVGAAMALLTLAYIQARNRSDALTPRWIAGLAVGYAVAALFKEHAFMLPGLLLAAELTLIEDPRPWRARFTTIRPLLLALVLAAAIIILARNAVLGGDTKGTFTAEGLIGLSMGGRAITMLEVVPEWIRLFLWPAHLSADYSPQVIVGSTHWGIAQTLGAALLVALLLLAWYCRRRRPVQTFGLLWIAVGLFPVSNVLIPTGIVLAERTLFLASMGAVLCMADALWLVGPALYARGGTARILVTAFTGLLLGAGLVRSATRMMVWHDLTFLWMQTLLDAPNSYRAHHAYAQVLFEAHSEGEAEQHYRRAMELYPPAWPVALDLADKYRKAGQCEPAIKRYRDVLSLTPDHPAARASMIACMMYVGDYKHAASESLRGISYGRQVKSFQLYLQVADSAERVHAPPKSVSLPAPPDSLNSR